MTKREALHIAMKAVAQQPDCVTNKKAIELLKSIEAEVCRRAWTRESCIEALTEWKQRTGQAPVISNLQADGMPSKFILERVFGERATVVLKQLFPDGYARRYCDRSFSSMSQADLLKFVCKQIEDIQPSRGADYNKSRPAGSPTWETIAKKLGCHSWRELYSKAMGDNAVYQQRKECKILQVEVKSPLIDDLHTLLNTKGV